MTLGGGAVIIRSFTEHGIDVCCLLLMTVLCVEGHSLQETLWSMILMFAVDGCFVCRRSLQETLRSMILMFAVDGCFVCRRSLQETEHDIDVCC